LGIEGGLDMLDQLRRQAEAGIARRRLRPAPGRQAGVGQIAHSSNGIGSVGSAPSTRLEDCASTEARALILMMSRSGTEVLTMWSAWPLLIRIGSIEDGCSPTLIMLIAMLAASSRSGISRLDMRVRVDSGKQRRPTLSVYTASAHSLPSASRWGT